MDLANVVSASNHHPNKKQSTSKHKQAPHMLPILNVSLLANARLSKTSKQQADAEA
jgi:hypothetical protein